MRYLITLELQTPNNSLAYVEQLAGFDDLEIDIDRGLVLISPKRNLYAIYVLGNLDPAGLMSAQAAVKGVWCDRQI
ncbi:MAG: hypothetical protein KME17_16985 [Cyanosarcina radialis HA8281-LM2]|jgi:hypothetical protein|nr:hypothetical protein [Cyanosarcina radialis HA8281-LM2]